jgi:hypothetical protein
MFKAWTCVLHVVVAAAAFFIDVKEAAKDVFIEEESPVTMSIPITSFCRSSAEFPASRRRTTMDKRKSTGALFLGSERRMATNASENPALLRRIN